jgi:hypothetical protein
MPSLYESPESHGYELFGDAGWSGGYEWDVFVVYRNIATGEFYYVYDGGCSCNDPAMSIETDADLTGPVTISQIHSALDEWAQWASHESSEITDLHAKLAGIL